MAEKNDIEHVHTGERRPSLLGELRKTDTVDTLHNDEAVKVLAAYHGNEEWTEAEEKRVVKKIDRRLLPLLILTYGVQYYDKAMLSQAVSIGRYSLADFSDFVIGNLRSTNRPRSDQGQPLLVLSCHLLPWLHRRCNSRYHHGSTLSH